MQKLAILFILFLTLDARATCLDASRVSHDLLSKFTFITEDGKELRPDLCDEKTTATSTLKTLLFLRDIPNHDLEKSDFNPGLIGSNPFAFFESRVKKIVVIENPQSERCPDSRLAFVSPVSRDEKTIWICPNSKSFDELVFSSALIHEARHLDGNEFAHRPCLSGVNKGSLSCDDRYADGGAYAIGLEYLVRLSKNPGVSERFRARARQLAIVDFFQRFNELPLDIQSGALLRTANDGALHFYDGEKTTRLDLKLEPHSALALQGGLLTALDPQTTEAKQYAFTDGWLAAASDVLVDRFSQLPREKQKTIVDLAYGSTEACLLLTDSLECFGRDREPFSKSLEGIKPKKFLTSSASRILEPGALFLVSEDNTVYRLPPEIESLRSQKPASWKAQIPPLLAVQPWTGPMGSGEIALGQDGRLSILSYRTRKWTPAVDAPSTPVRDLLAPFYWSPRLREL